MFLGGGGDCVYVSVSVMAPSCLSQAVCPLFPNGTHFKISNCLEDASLRHCCFVFVDTCSPPPSPLVRLQHTCSHGLITPVTRHLPEKLCLTASLYALYMLPSHISSQRDLSRLQSSFNVITSVITEPWSASVVASCLPSDCIESCFPDILTADLRADSI